MSDRTESERSPERPESGQVGEPIAAELVVPDGNVVWETEVALANSAASGPGVEYRRRRIRLPIIFFLLTCCTTFWSGANRFWPMYEGMETRRIVYANWQGGLVYMACLLGILFAHEMGHFLYTVRYRIAASLPYFIPCPIGPIGTFGAVIGMESMRADRKEMFDIGIGGPLAGLVIAVPVFLIGLSQVDFTAPTHGPFSLGMPLAMQWALQFLQPEGYDGARQLVYSQLNPCLLAGWVGLLVTGLNMVPVGQFDGGHIAYTVFGKRIAHTVARVFLVTVIAYAVYSASYELVVMITLFVLVGPDHPPTRDDLVPLGWFRWSLGVVSMAIPLVCLSPQILILR